MRYLLLLALLPFTACGSSTDTPDKEAIPATTTSKVKLYQAVKAYSDAYLTGDGETAYNLLSTRCQDTIGKQPFMDEVAAAKSTFGDAMPFKSFNGMADGDQARVTYTYSVAAIDQEEQPWTREDGSWKYDDC